MIGTFRLTFATNFGENLELSIPRANINITEEEVRTAMDRIMNSGVVESTTKGRPIQRYSARLLKTQITEFGL